MPSESIEIVSAGAERINDLEPLWGSLSEHHVAVAPHLRELGPLRSPAESWEVRRALYEEWLAEPDAFVLIAADGAPRSATRSSTCADPRRAGTRATA
jgi:hypothetical protein